MLVCIPDNNNRSCVLLKHITFTMQESKYTPLHLAASMDKVEVLSLLIHHGGDVGIKDQVI